MKNIFDIYNKIDGIIWSILFYPFFKSSKISVRINKPLRLKGFKNISISENVLIQKGSWLEALPLTGLSCNLIINKGATIGHFNHIYATHHIEIGENALIADKVYISDNLHSYENINLPIILQPIKQLKKVLIGNGAWIGENVCIIGATIGNNSVIGANSVVTKDIPSYSVAVGSPAIVIKRYNFDSERWEKTNENGEFIK